MIKFLFTAFKKNSNSNGFTIMEVIVVIFIISIGLVSILSLVTQNVQVEYVNKNMIIASQLAQEGLEIVRNVRDNNWLAGYNWKTGDISDPNTNLIKDGNYAIDLYGIYDVSGTGADGINDEKTKIYYEAGGFFRHQNFLINPEETIFSRIITVDGGSGAEPYLILTCLVQWNIKNSTKQYSIQTILYDWK